MNRIYNMKAQVKWAVIVGLNSVLGFIFGNIPGDYPFLLGILSGIFSWFVAYLCLNKYLIKTGRIKQSRKLALCAIFRIPLQLTFFPDMFAGIFAASTIEFLGFSNLDNRFFDAYSATIFTGLYLSILCSVIYLLISAVEKFKEARETTRENKLA